LAFQACVAFGHVHFSRVDSRLALALSGGEGDASAGSLPQKHPAHPSVEFCAICANINLAGMLILPTLAIVLTPGLFGEILPWPLAASGSTSFDYLPFRARAPPHA
jgi:hypothetical protein